ncbi:hypothetical protein CerSpe_283830 [Prunus speciosa]
MEQFKGHPRLPKFAVPKGYDDMTFKPDLTAFNFGGAVAVELDIISDIWLVVRRCRFRVFYSQRLFHHAVELY